MNLLEVYIDSLPIDKYMDFGIHKNVILNAIDIKSRTTNKGELSKKNFFMEFLQLDKDGDPVERIEFDFFKLNAENKDYLEMNFYDQFNKLLHLSTVVYDDDKALDAAFDAADKKVFKDEEDGLLEFADTVFEQTVKRLPKGKKMKIAEFKKAVEELNTKLNEVFYEVLKDKVGENSPKMILLVVVDAAGYRKMIDEAEFVLTSDEEASIDEKYFNRKRKSEEKDEPDDVGDEPDDDEYDDEDDTDDSDYDEDDAGDDDDDDASGDDDDDYEDY